MNQKQKFKFELEQIKKNNNRNFQIFKDMRYNPISHPNSYIDYECMFASTHISNRSPKSILDIGSYRLFIIGLLANYKVTTIDVRKRTNILNNNETLITSDIKSIDTSSICQFDCIVTLSSIEHFGLGRYNDIIDYDGDINAFEKMVSMLCTGGMLIFSTTITQNTPSIVFNLHRIYNYEQINTLCHSNNLTVYSEKFYNTKTNNEVTTIEKITKKLKEWDVYCGCWIKN